MLTKNGRKPLNRYCSNSRAIPIQLENILSQFDWKLPASNGQVSLGVCGISLVPTLRFLRKAEPFLKQHFSSGYGCFYDIGFLGCILPLGSSSNRWETTPSWRQVGYSMLAWTASHSDVPKKALVGMVKWTMCCLSIPSSLSYTSSQLALAAFLVGYLLHVY